MPSTTGFKQAFLDIFEAACNTGHADALQAFLVMQSQADLATCYEVIAENNYARCQLAVAALERDQPQPLSVLLAYAPPTARVQILRFDNHGALEIALCNNQLDLVTQIMHLSPQEYISSVLRANLTLINNIAYQDYTELLQAIVDYSYDPRVLWAIIEGSVNYGSVNDAHLHVLQQATDKLSVLALPDFTMHLLNGFDTIITPLITHGHFDAFCILTRPLSTQDRAILQTQLTCLEALTEEPDLLANLVPAQDILRQSPPPSKTTARMLKRYFSQALEQALQKNDFYALQQMFLISIQQPTYAHIIYRLIDDYLATQYEDDSPNDALIYALLFNTKPTRAQAWIRSNDTIFQRAICSNNRALTELILSIMESAPQHLASMLSQNNYSALYTAANQQDPSFLKMIFQTVLPCCLTTIEQCIEHNQYAMILKAALNGHFKIVQLLSETLPHERLPALLSTLEAQQNQASSFNAHKLNHAMEIVINTVLRDIEVDKIMPADPAPLPPYRPTKSRDSAALRRMMSPQTPPHQQSPIDSADSSPTSENTTNSKDTPSPGTPR